MLSSPATLVRLQRITVRPGKRALHDLVTLPDKRPIIAQGPPGRSAVTGHVATVFGCTGFLGRYLVAKLAKAGTQVIIPYRDEDEKRHLKVMGDLGQIVSMEWDIRNEKQIEECVRHSDIVYNLVGRDYETKNFDFRSVNAVGAGRIAGVSAKAGVQRFVHVSHLNASAESPSQFYRAKAEGEALVKQAFPTATIVRPGTLFGYEDKLLQNMPVWPIWWRLNHGETKIRPVHVMDVAQALTNLISMPTLSRTLALPGPSTLSYEYLLELISTLTYNPPSRAPVLPQKVALALAKLAQKVWWPALSPDEVVRRYIDEADTPGDWDVVGVEPDEIESHAITYVRRYRSAVNYVRPIVLPPRPVTQ
ncbi:39kDa subunit of Ndufa9, NADH ubiquinone oxidoreductase [Auriscalpium vulgare]|uniref:39kDa subunit of Ndufa9, NADH ubiquinone oxidoreductase n=1 Tax=Auriscalpium vulgare TaxID=40419 RepID=A0ACB8RDQ4_9AGAM|nr:39kDa subunit of Ndufa9, NADH ubiquinone oxidoreductase [Auriscalpium vulgare]